MKKLIILFSVALSSCSLQEKQKMKLLSNTSKKEELKDHYIPRMPPLYVEHKIPDLYPWERASVTKQIITMEELRCKGCSHNSPRTIHTSKGRYLVTDCLPHGLPLEEGKELQRNTFLELLNYIQSQVTGKIKILSGHRCPQHQLYLNQSADPLESPFVSVKAVAFTVEGYESTPHEIIPIIEGFYKGDSRFSPYSEFTTFIGTRFAKANKEIRISIPKYGDDELPAGKYILIELLWDRSTNNEPSLNWSNIMNLGPRPARESESNDQ